MALETALESLQRELARLRDVVSALRVTTLEDRPARGAVVLVDHLDNLVTDLSSALEEADARLTHAIQSSQPNGPLDIIRAALGDVHELLNRFTASYISDLAAHTHIAQLLEMGRERGREWREWSQEIKTAIERCASPLRVVASTLLDCWSELSERLARNSVSVQATNIGQHITVREDQVELVGRAK